MIGAIIGLLSLLLALVLGTLIGSAYSFYSTQKSEMETFASRALQLDLALAEYGPETAPARAQMKDTLTMVRRMLWWRDESGTMRPDFTVAEPIPHLKATDEYVASLDPKTRLKRNSRQPRRRIRQRHGADQAPHLAATRKPGLLAVGRDCGVVGD